MKCSRGLINIILKRTALVPVITLIIFIISGYDAAGEGTGKKVRLLVNQLAASGVSDSDAKEISDKLYARLSALKGADNVVYRGIGDKRSANRILKGRISMLGKSRIIAVDIIDGDKGKLIFNASVTVKAGESLDDYIDKLANQIVEKSSIWE